MTEREQIIDGLLDFVADLSPFAGNHGDWEKVHRAIKYLKELASDWISVKERMPSDEEVEHTKFGFLCYIEGFFIMPDGFAILPYNKEAKEFWSLANNRAIDNVTHWMPLPEQPT